MEVHHHSHTARKKWTHYFWEFLMLFLAVFCGFLAEYQLEHKIEKDREKQFIESFIENLKTDSARNASIIELNKQQVTGFDSLLHNIYQKHRTDSSVKALYYYHRKHTVNLNRMLFSKSTITQLKNSGGFRLIRKKAVADSIAKYDTYCERIENQAEGVDYSGKLLFELSVKLFNSEYFLDNNSLSDFLTSSIKPALLTNDEILIKEYANLAMFKRNAINFYIVYLTNLQSRIPAIINFLKKEYHLK